MICEPGYDRVDVYDTILITHGTSLMLMKAVTECLQSSDLHNINPTKDWKKGKKRNLNNYYAFASTQLVECASCARLLYNADTLIIEYLYTIPEARGLGIGKMMVDFCRTLVDSRALHVIATEDACAYWMKLGFVWDQSVDSKSLKEFNDTYFLSDCSALGGASLTAQSGQ